LPNKQVTQGQGLAAVEAMKMEHLVVAPRAGRVRGMDVAQGQQVRACVQPLIKV
jgi:biotin carboxyl carrier protein